MNPCAAADKCCSELADKCLPKGEQGCIVGFESCDGEDGSRCNDHNPCTSDDSCHQGYCRGNDNGTCPDTAGDGQVGDGEECDVHLDDRCPGHCGLDRLCHEDCANSADDDLDGKIDCEDSECQGIACACLPIGRDPATIRFAKDGDRLTIHGSIAPCAPFDALPLEVAAMPTNADGVVHSAALPAGSLVRRGPRRVEYRDPAAKRTRSGVARVRIRERSGQSGRMTFFIESYGDLSAADTPDMTFQLRLGDHVFVNSATWKETAGGWFIQLPH